VKLKVVAAISREDRTKIFTGFSVLTERMKAMSAQLDALIVQVEATNTVMGAAVNLINGLAAEVTAIKDQLAAQGIDNAKLNDLAAALDSADDPLAAAIAANTPAAPEPIPEPDPLPVVVEPVDPNAPA